MDMEMRLTRLDMYINWYLISQRKTYFKYLDNDKKILRYTARLNTRIHEDVDRRFIIQFFLSDDSISIYEPSLKELGLC